MKRIFLLIGLCVITWTATKAQLQSNVKKVNKQEWEIVQKAKRYIASSLNLVFYLACDNVPGWDANLVGSHSAVFGDDLYGNKEHAIVFSAGHNGLQARPDDYIKGDFSISVFVKVESVSKWSRIIDFGIGQNNSNIVFSNSASMSGIPGMAIYKGEGSDITQIRGKENNRLKEGEWRQIGATLKDNVATLYLDGVEINKVDNFYTPGNVHRPMCLIGKSNFEGESNFYGSMDDLRIYNKAISDIEMKLLAGWIFELDSIPVDTLQKTVPQPSGSTSGQKPGGSDPGSGTAQKTVSQQSGSTSGPWTVPPQSGTGKSSPFPDEPFPLLCSKYTYKTLETVEPKSREQIEADINKLYAPYNKTNWHIKGDFSMARAYCKAGDEEKWEHKFVMFSKGDNGVQLCNTMGNEGWEMVYFQLYGATFSRPLNPSLQKKWEYTIVSPPEYAKDEKELSTNRTAAEAFLNEYGKQGWEILSIMRNQHIMKREAGAGLTYEYRIIQASGIVPFELSASGWEFGACPAIQNSVNFLTPIVIKKSSNPQYKIYIAEQVERLGMLGGGNTNVYNDLDAAIQKYASLGWKYEDLSDGLENANIVFSAPLNCLDPHKPVIYCNYAVGDPAATFLAARFTEFLRGENYNQIIPYPNAGKEEVMSKAKESVQLQISGLKGNSPLPEIDDFFFSDLGYAVNAQFVVNGQLKSFEFKQNLSREEMQAKFGEMLKAKGAMKK